MSRAHRALADLLGVTPARRPRARSRPGARDRRPADGGALSHRYASERTLQRDCPFADRCWEGEDACLAADAHVHGGRHAARSLCSLDDAGRRQAC